ncbi:uncharacterized protein LOC143462523 isoform X2 [Clavelina lepadiformis]|uniref:uncharacterized protein LOC143462523 isoform X2 n=1 Tax=Clavelina lepadiformis TaxID=159417 RepID=UPI004041B3FE
MLGEKRMDQRVAGNLLLVVTCSHLFNTEVAACGDVERLNDLLEQHRIDRDEKDEDWDGRTPLFWSAIEGHYLCVKKLLQAGANPTLRNHNEKTVAHYAAESGRYGDTAMDHALLYGNLECADLISQALRGEFNYRVDPSYWKNGNSPPKMFRPDPRKKQNLMSLLSAMKSGKEQEPPDGKLARTRRKKRPSVQKTKGSLQD